MPLFSSKETFWLGPPVKGCRKENLIHPFWVSLEPGNICNNLSPFFILPLYIFLCSIIETSIQTWTRWFFVTWIHQLLCLLVFQIKSLFLAPRTCLSMYCPFVESSAILDLVTVLPPIPTGFSIYWSFGQWMKFSLFPFPYFILIVAKL